MTRSLRLTAAAEDDLREARRWYQQESPHVDPKFRDAVGEALERIGESPTLYPVVHRGVRRALVARFPYAIFYRLREDLILVIGVVHHARNPEIWKRRG